MSLIERLLDKDRKMVAADVLNKPQAKRMVGVKAQKPSFKVRQLAWWRTKRFSRMVFKSTEPQAAVKVSRNKVYVIDQHGRHNRAAENRLKASPPADLHVEPI